MGKIAQSGNRPISLPNFGAEPDRKIGLKKGGVLNKKIGLGKKGVLRHRRCGHGCRKVGFREKLYRKEASDVREPTIATTKRNVVAT